MFAAGCISRGQIVLAVALAVVGVTVTAYPRVLRIPAAVVAVVAFLFLPPAVVVVAIAVGAVLGPVWYLQMQRL